MEIKMKDIIKEKFLKNVIIDNDTGCWNFAGALRPDGYGSFCLNKKQHNAHRASWILFMGDIPNCADRFGLCVCHACDNRKCVNVEHLFLGTHRANSRDMVVKNRSAKGEKHGRSKLKEDEVKIIIRSYNNGIPKSKLASIFNVSQDTIYNIMSMKTWAHIKM